MGKKTEREKDRIFKPPESPHFQTAADSIQQRTCLSAIGFRFYQALRLLIQRFTHGMGQALAFAVAIGS